MTFWLLAAFLLLLTLVGIGWPLLHRGPHRADASDVQIYKDQLRELDRDIDRGIVAGGEGEASRIEISRRLLKAAQNQRREQGDSLNLARIAAIALLFVLPIASVVTYLGLGSPDVPDAPLHARQEPAADATRLEQLVTRVEAHLRQQPDDGEGWRVVAPVYLRQGRFDEAVAAYANVLRLTQPTAELWSTFGEALVMRAQGVISPRAREAFEEARKLAPQDVKPRFYLALAFSQEQRFPEAEKAWSDLLVGAPEGAPWTQMAQARLSEARAGIAGASPNATAGGDLPGPDQGDVEAAQDMTPQERQAFIASMVARLKTRLDADGGTPEEWVRLLRAYSVLGNQEEARAAFAKARSAFAADETARALIERSAEELGITSQTPAETQAQARAGTGAASGDAEVRGDLPGPDRGDMEAAQDLTPEERNAFVASMVLRLKNRLESDGGTPEEWVRLLRSFAVLGNRAEAVEVYEKARSAFAADASARAHIERSAEELGITAQTPAETQ